MAAPIPTTTPASLIAGDTAKWQLTLPDYPANDGWAVGYTLINADAKIIFSASASGADHLINVAAASTASWAAGSYQWRATASKSGEVYTVGTGTLTIQPAFSVATLDVRSFAAKTLEAIEAYLSNGNNLQAQEYEIAGRRLKRMSYPELIAARDKFRAEVAREISASNIARGLPDGRRVYVRFGP